MKIDWKYFATTPGYKSLKAAYVRDVQESEKDRDRLKCKPMRDKQEFLKHLNWVISRAIHYAHHKNVPVWEILDAWEAKRSYWWLNYYQDSNQPKIHSRVLKPIGIKGLRKYYRNSWMGFRRSKTKRKLRMRDAIVRLQKEKSAKSPARWEQHRRLRQRIRK